MGTFRIDHDNNTIQVEQQDSRLFVVKLEDRTIRLVQKQDNEGANHWFEEGSDNETPETKALGNAIDTYLAKEDN